MAQFMARLWLNSQEREMILRWIDELKDTDVDNMDEWDKNNDRATLLTKMIFGKDQDYPLHLEMIDNESTD